jgi:hypothetical protein
MTFGLSLFLRRSRSIADHVWLYCTGRCRCRTNHPPRMAMQYISANHNKSNQNHGKKYYSTSFVFRNLFRYTIALKHIPYNTIDYRRCLGRTPPLPSVESTGYKPSSRSKICSNFFSVFSQVNFFEKAANCFAWDATSGPFTTDPNASAKARGVPSA